MNSRAFVVLSRFSLVDWGTASAPLRGATAPLESPSFKLGVIFYIIRYISHACGIVR